MDTNLTDFLKLNPLKNGSKERRKKRNKEEEDEKEEPHIFVPGCTRCHQLHLTSMTCPQGEKTEQGEFPDQMRPAAAFRTSKRREVTTGYFAAETNNNSVHQRNRNGPPPPPQAQAQHPSSTSGRRAGGGGGSRRHPMGLTAPPRRPPRTTYLESSRPPPQPLEASSSSQAFTRPMSQLMAGFDRLSFQNRRAPRPPPASSSSSRYPRGTGETSYRSQQPRRNPLQSMQQRPNRHVVPPNEAHMRRLNDQLRQFSYGSEDMYHEVPLPPPKDAVKAAAVTPTVVVPRVPKNKMYVFTTRTVFDEHGRQLAKTSKNQIVEVPESHVIFVDYYDDLEL